MTKYLFIMAQEGHRWGGSEPLWSSAAEHLVRQGNEVRISVKDWGSPVPQISHLESVGCKVFYRKDPNGIPPFIQRQLQRVFPPDPYWESHLRAVGSHVDLVIISQTHNGDGLEWMEAARISGKRYVAIAQSAVVYWWPPDDRAERLAVAHERADACYFVSQAILDISRLQFGTPLPKARVVRNPFNVRYDANPPWPGAPDDCLRLACVARVDIISKSHDVLLQVLALPHWRQRRVRVSIVGTGPHERSVRRMVDQLHLSNVSLLGQIEDVETIWADHHGLVLPSRFEGMPLVVVEAMLCARPCIVTDVGGNRELVRDGVNGFLAKAPTVELFDEALSRAWENRCRLKEIGERAAADVREWVSEDPGLDLAHDLIAVAHKRAPA